MRVQHNITLLSWFSFFSAFKLYSAFAGIYFVQVTHSVALGIGVLSTIQIANAAFEIPTGFLSDRLGRKPVLFVGAVAKLLSLVCYATGQSFAIFAVGAIFDGLAVALFSGNNEALLYDSANQVGEKDKYSIYLGKVRSMAYPSLLIASLLGGLIASISLPFLFWLSLIPQIICVALSVAIVEPEQHDTKINSTNKHFLNAIKLLYQNIQLKRLSIAEVFTQGVEEVAFQLQLLFYNMLWPVWAVGVTRSIMALGKFISFRYSFKLTDRFSATSVLVFNTSITRIIHMFSLLFPTPASPLFMTSTSFLWGSIEVSRNRLLQEQFTDSQRATMYSLLSFLGSIFAGLLGLVVGVVSDRIGVRSTLLVLQVLFIPIVVLYVQYALSEKKKNLSKLGV